VDDEMAEKVREALEMMLMAPAGTSMNDFMSRFQVSEQDLPAFNIMWQKIIYPITIWVLMFYRRSISLMRRSATARKQPRTANAV